MAAPLTPERSDVAVFVASWNAQHATELCIRSMYRYAGHPFDLFVGHSGSRDGSEPMLRSLERDGLLRLEVASTHRHHADWLDDWLARCSHRYCVFVDCDVEFLGEGWLRDLVAAAREGAAALVCGEFEEERPDYEHPHTGQRMRIAARPGPYVLLLDPAQVRDIEVSFAQVIEEDAGVPEGAVSFDTAALFFREVERRGLRWVVMPESFRRMFVHYGSVSWGTTLARWTPTWVRTVRKRVKIRARLLAYRLPRLRTATT